MTSGRKASHMTCSLFSGDGSNAKCAVIDRRFFTGEELAVCRGHNWDKY